VNEATAEAEFGTVAGDQLLAVFQSVPGPTQVCARAKPHPATTKATEVSLKPRKLEKGDIRASQKARLGTAASAPGLSGSKKRINQESSIQADKHCNATARQSQAPNEFLSDSTQRRARRMYAATP